MKHIERLLILMMGLAAAGGLGYRFQPKFEPDKYMIFAAVIVIVGEILRGIDRYISNRSQKR